MKTFGFSLLVGLGGYLVGVLLGVLLVNLTSTKSDRSTEAAMTGFLFVGPVVALLSFLAALFYRLH